MKISDDGTIKFNNVIITPIERWIDKDFDLEPETVAKLNRLAEMSKQSVDNVLNHILADFFAEHLNLSELNGETLRKAAEKSSYMMIMENGKPVARVKMITWGDGNLVFTSEKKPPEKHYSKEQPEPVTNCDWFMKDKEIASIESSKKIG